MSRAAGGAAGQGDRETSGGLFELADGHDVRLITSACDRCAQLWFPERSVCGACGSREMSARRVGPAGTIYASTVVRAGAPGFDAPYDLAYLDVEGLRVLVPVQADGLAVSAPDPGTAVRLVADAFGPLATTYVARLDVSDGERLADA